MAKKNTKKTSETEETKSEGVNQHLVDVMAGKCDGQGKKTKKEKEKA